MADTKTKYDLLLDQIEALTTGAKKKFDEEGGDGLFNNITFEFAKVLNLLDDGGNSCPQGYHRNEDGICVKDE